MPNNITIYEQPITEQLRVCARLEFLFLQFENHLSRESSWDSQTCLKALIDILNILDRPDIRTKFLKVIIQSLHHLSPQNTQDKVLLPISEEKIEEMSNLRNEIENANGKFGTTLCDNVFLHTLRMHFNNPGGGCRSDLPNLYHWLHLPYSERHQHLSSWKDDLNLVYKTVAILLNYIRNNQVTRDEVAPKGMYQSNIDPTLPNQLIQVRLASNFDGYPEISVGRHRFSILFYSPDYRKEASTQIIEEVPFSVSCCSLIPPVSSLSE